MGCPRSKNGDGSIKLCKTMNALWATGWTDPEKTRKMVKRFQPFIVNDLYSQIDYKGH